MEIITKELVDLSKYNKSGSASVHLVHVKIKDHQERAREMIDTIKDTSWISKLDVIGQRAYSARANQTIERIVNDVLSKVDNTVSSSFGEYLVSESAQVILSSQFQHVKLPLAELWKEKVEGNPGFDFHTESPAQYIVFGEAKYSSSDNPHTDALKQAVGFIASKKDDMDLADLRSLASKEAVENCVAFYKGYAIAFSINGSRYDQIFSTVLKSNDLDELLSYPEVYLIGIEL
jgi:hypothetical protein